MPTDSRNPDAAKPSAASNTLLEQLQEHVVQIEALNVYIVLVVGVLFLASAVDFLKPYLVPLACAFLAATRAVVRVTNPTSSLRNRLMWGASLGGIGSAIGTAVGLLIDVASLGMTAGAATAAGLALGGIIGAAAGDRIEKAGNPNELLERGKAFAHLYSYRHKNSELANPSRINYILDNMPAYDINSDGRLWYTIVDLERVARGRE